MGDRVFARAFPRWGNHPFEQTIGAVAGADGVMLVDTTASPRRVRQVLREVRRLIGQDVVAAVNTHHHWDHTFGNDVVAEQAPIWGHARCGERLLSENERRRGELLEAAPSMRAEIEEVVLTPPSRSFARSATIDLGDRRIRLRHVGPAHTDNDVLVMVEGASVTFVGDLVGDGFRDAHPASWLRTLRSLRPVLHGTLVPGHGAPTGPQVAERAAAMLDEVVTVARRVAAGELSLEQGARLIDLPRDSARLAIQRALDERAVERATGERPRPHGEARPST